MSRSIIIPCCQRDEALIPLIVSNLRDVGYLDDIIIAPCAANPPQTNLTVTSSVRWHTTHVTEDMLLALQSVDSSIVFKLDVDMFFYRLPAWMDDELSTLHGYTHSGYHGYIFGALYGLPKSLISHLLEAESTPTTLEDVGLSRRALATQVNIEHKSELYGWSDAYPSSRFKSADIVHLGQNIERSLIPTLHAQLST